MKTFNALANREFLVFVAIVASAITLHVREHVPDRAELSHASYSRMCEPAAHPSGRARLRPADCDVRATAPAVRIARPWV